MASRISVPVVWILGGPGSGKSTQCTKIVQKYGVVQISTGDLLRREATTGSAIGREISITMQRGDLVATPVVFDLVKNEIFANSRNARGFVIDGYPRDVEQGQLFDTQIKPADVILYLEASDITLIRRLRERGRADDNDETIREELRVFHSTNNGLLNEYEQKVKRINAEASAEEVFRVVEAYLDSHFL